MKILSVVVNNPIFIELQYRSIKKFIQEDIELIIFNDAKSYKDITNFNDPTMRSQIEDKCKELNIQCIPIETPQNNWPASIRHSMSLNFMTKYMMNHVDKYWVIDCDMCFVDFFDIHAYQEYGFCYVEQSRMINGVKIFYPWGNLFYIDFTKDILKDMISWDTDYGLDTGGKNHIWLSKLNPSMKKAFQLHHFSCNWDRSQLAKNINPVLLNFFEKDVRNKNGLFFAEVYLDALFHYRAGSGWMNESPHVHKEMICLFENTFTLLLETTHIEA